MTEEDVELLEALPHVEPEPEQPQPEKTKLDQFKELLAQYPTAEEAKTHIKEIAKKLDCAPSLGYKAVKRIEKFGAPKHKPKEPTVKIPEAKPEAIPEPEEEEVEEIEVEEEAPAERPAELPPTSTMEKLMPIFERAVGRLFNQTIELVSGSKEMLSEQEAKDTATLLPILLYRMTKTQLNEDQFIDATCITHFGAIVVRVIKTKVNEWRAKKEKEKIVQPPPTPTPEPEPPKPEQPAEPTEAEIEAKKREQRPDFLKKLS
jgi:hypothetical protein